MAQHHRFVPPDHEIGLEEQRQEEGRAGAFFLLLFLLFPFFFFLLSFRETYLVQRPACLLYLRTQHDTPEYSVGVF